MSGNLSRPAFAIVAGEGRLQAALAASVRCLMGAPLLEWPQDGLPWQGALEWAAVNEFIVSAQAASSTAMVLPAGYRLVLAAGRSGETSEDAWGWLISRTWPGKRFRWIGDGSRLVSLFSTVPVEATNSAFSFNPAFLGSLFHDLREERRPLCAETAMDMAAWFASLDEGLLWPFRSIARAGFWDDWEAKWRPACVEKGPFPFCPDASHLRYFQVVCGWYYCRIDLRPDHPDWKALAAAEAEWTALEASS